MAEAKNNRISVRIKEIERRLFHLLNCRLSRDVEYDFAYRNIFRSNDKLRILDVGGCGSLLPLILAKKNFEVTVFDFRSYPEVLPNLKVYKGDFLQNKLPDSYFDFVILISCIEHIGFGSYKAPRYDDGDFRAICEIKRILSSNGRAIITFPFAKTHTIIDKFERWYDADRIKKLFTGMYILKEEYWIPELKRLGHWIRWKPGELKEAQNSVNTYNTQSIACFVVSINPPNTSKGCFQLYHLNEGEY